MDVKTKAKRFAIKAHTGQKRKNCPDKPMIIHPLNVANILSDYGFDDNVVAAGYLHDVVEDTKYTIEDIEKHFGKDIKSLVMGATEPDKSLPWEERKQHTIDSIKKLDLRHKALVCADKISNLEDLRIDCEIAGKYDFSSFKRGFSKQKWYYTGIYNSLIYHQDKNLPMFNRLKELIDYIFYPKKDLFLEKIFKGKKKEYNQLKKIHYRKEEIYKLKELLNNKPYIIEFTGTPRTGKTTLINNLYDFFKKKGFKVMILEEFTTSSYYKNDLYPKIKNKSKLYINTMIPKYVEKQLNTAKKENPDIIIIDRSLLDRLIWIDRLYLKKGMTKKEYSNYKKENISKIKNNINIIISTYTDPLTALKRDYYAHLSLEKRSFLNEQNVNEFNTSLLNILELSKKENINMYLFDTTKKTEREISIEVVNEVLKNMRSYYLERIYNEIK